jgi:hypothetical protein
MATLAKKPRFDQTSVLDLLEFLGDRQGKRLLLTDIDSFYEAKPQYRGIFAGRLSKVAELYPNFISIERDQSTGELYLHPVETGAAGENSVTLTQDDSPALEEAVELFITFLRDDCHEKALPASALSAFYAKHQKYEGMFDGSSRWRLLRRHAAGRIALEKIGQDMVFRLVDENEPDSIPPTTYTCEYAERVVVVNSGSLKDVDIQPFLDSDKIVIDVDGALEKQKPYYIAAFIEGTLLILDFRRALLPQATSTIEALFGDEGPLKVGFYWNIIASLLKPVLEHKEKLANIFDVVAAYGILSNEPQPVTALGDILAEYEIPIKFDPELSSPVAAWKSAEAPLPINAIARYCFLAAQAFERIREDAYSRSKLDSCMRASTESILKPIYAAEEDYRLLKDPTTRKAVETAAGFKSQAQSFKSRLANAKRRCSLTSRRLPPNACVHFHVQTPGSCEKGFHCKFKHELHEGSLQ